MFENFREPRTEMAWYQISTVYNFFVNFEVERLGLNEKNSFYVIKLFPFEIQWSLFITNSLYYEFCRKTINILYILLLLLLTTLILWTTSTDPECIPIFIFCIFRKKINFVWKIQIARYYD